MIEPITVKVPHCKFHDPFEVEKALILGGVPAKVWDSSSSNIRVREGSLTRYYDPETLTIVFTWTPPKENPDETA